MLFSCKKKDILTDILCIKSARRCYWSGGPMVSTDRRGLLVLWDLELNFLNSVWARQGSFHAKRISLRISFAWKKRETGLEPAASTLARSRSTNWATRAYHIVFCCSPQDKWYHTAASPKSQALFLFFYIFYFFYSTVQLHMWNTHHMPLTLTLFS